MIKNTFWQALFRGDVMRGFKGALVIAAALFAAVAVSPRLFAAGTSTQLRSIELTPDEGGLRITLATSSLTSHELFTLAHPNRVVIDLRRTRLASGVRMPEGVGLIETVRSGDRPGGTLRIVLELKSALPARSQWFAGGEGGSRLVIALGKAVALDGAGASMATAQSAVPKIVRAEHAPADGDRDVVIAVDAGHGGTDPGAIGRNGTREKDITLAIART